MCAVHVSVAVELAEALGLKLPEAHSSHSGAVVDVPATLVKLPAGQTLSAEQLSVVVELADASAFDVPAAHSSHTGSVVEVPIAEV